MYNIKMKLNGENITIGPIDTNEDGLISKGQEITRFDLIKADVVRLFIDTILEEGVSDEEKGKDIERLKSKIASLLENENTVLLECAGKIISEGNPGIKDVELKLNELLEQLISGNREAGQKILSVFEAYESCQKEVYDRSSEKIPELKNFFVKRMRDFSNSSELDIDMEKVEELVGHAKFIFHDGSFFEDLGAHNSSNEIYINTDGLMCFGIDNVNNILLHTVFHELLHTVSEDWGHLIFTQDNPQPINTRSGGVNFSGNFNKERNKRGFVWLNEAFTETFTIFISDTDSVSYLDERILLNLLTRKGKIDLVHKLSKSYFRHISKDENMTSTEEWRNFSKEIDSVFGPRFLVKLDIFIEKYGIKEALKIIDKWEDGKPMPETLE